MMKEFKPTSWAIKNRTSMYILTFIIVVFGIVQYITLQKERFPDIVIPTIYVATPYPGTSPADIENLVTRPIEKQIKGISGVKKISSNSLQDYSAIAVEFNTGIRVEDAKQKVKDAVDKASKDLPTDLPTTPIIQDVNFSEIPIMYVNVSGNYPMDKLKKYSEDLQDKIETFKEITRVDLVGALDREVKVDVDMYKMQAARVTFNDIVNMIRSENITVTAGNIKVGDMSRSVRIAGQYVDADSIGNIVLHNASGASIYLKDIANVREGYKDRESYARLEHDPVITLNIIKRSGENLIDASDKVREAVEELKVTTFPSDLKITLTGDQSTMTRNTLNDLINSIIIGFILVTLILMFFMGTTNALFVALSVPLSSFLAFIAMPLIGATLGFNYSLNMIVLFSFLLALGIVVDDAIVVIENTHRIFHSTKKNIEQSAKEAAGEVFIPVLSGTLTTIAPFFPLLFWPGIVGNFMFYLPITLIVVLVASLFVAFIINPLFAVTFMVKDENSVENKRKANKQYRNWMIGMGVLAVIFYLFGNIGMGNLLIILALFITLNKFVFTKWIHSFQNKALPRFMHAYERLIAWMLKKKRPYLVLGSLFFLLIFSFIFSGLRLPSPVFFPKGDPNFVYVYLEMPIGTDISVTDSVTQIIEKRVYSVVGTDNPDVESIIANVAIGAGDPQDFNRAAAPNKGKVTIAFKEFKDRKGDVTTGEYLNKVRSVMKGIPGAIITVDQERNGPPTGKPVNIEITGEDFPTLIALSKQIKQAIDSAHIGGIEDLRSDLQDKKPEVIVKVDRVRANHFGISTGQIANEVRTAVFGFEASKFKQNEDEYPIYVRYAPEYRNSVDKLKDLKITYRDMATGLTRQIPLSAVANFEYSNSYGGINRKNMKRIINLSSNLLSGYTSNEVSAEISKVVKRMQLPAGYEINLGGEQEDQQESAQFLMMAGIFTCLLIFFILVLQFNSISKPLIILSEIVFSIIGVLLGFSIFKMTIAIAMTGVGFLALFGIVVKNGILLVEFTDELRARGHRTLEAIILAGRTRLTPVVLTASAAILGLLPLAIGMNINFFTLLTEFDPQFFVGGDSKTFWGPLAWAIIFGLLFATVVTLLVVPVMYLLNHRMRIWLKRRGLLAKGHKL